MRLRQIGAITRTYRHLKRYRQVLAVLFKYGSGELLTWLQETRYLGIGTRIFSRRRREQMEKLTRFERVRLAVEELGPTFIKAAQLLSTRLDLIPLEFAQELAKLQDQVPPFPFVQVRKILEEELKTSLEDRFQSLEEIPLAAASIGQVHRGRLRSGEEVVVKVQRPHIRRIIEVDLEILLHLATLVERHIEEWGFQRPTRIVEEMARTLEKEIDYTVEAGHAERFARQFKGNPSIHVPRIHRETSTARILTMEYLAGIKASEVTTLEQQGLDRKIIAARGADLILEQVFRHGFFHADPHPGNIFILPGNVIGYLDFGMMGSVDRQAREDFADLLFRYVRRDEAKIAQALLRIVEWDDEPDRRALEKDISEFMGLYLYQPLKELRFAGLLRQLLALMTRHRLRLPPDTFLMMKAMATAEGVGCLLDPDFTLAQKAAPFVKRLKLERLNPQRVWGEFLDSGGDLIQLVKEIPGEMSEILKQVKQGKVKIGVEHRELEKFALRVDRASNRIAFAMLISALVIGSFLGMRAGMGPLLWGFPFLGLFGFALAGLFTLGLLISLLRPGKF